MKRIVILGSTGSIGRSTLEVAAGLKGEIDVVGLSARRRTDLLIEQIETYRPRAAAVEDEALAGRVRDAVGSDIEVFSGAEGLITLARLPGADLVVNAVVGAVGIEPTLAAIQTDKDVAIANKECLVAAGALITAEARKRGRRLIPVDSEHSAVYQCVRAEDRAAIRRIVLTASGGPLIDVHRDRLLEVKASEALKHPNWEMGRKVTIDSATLLNKGFEVIEAHWLFGVDVDRIEVVVERKSIVHCLVEFVDGSVMALLSPPDMRIPIQYALTSPARTEQTFAGLDLAAIGAIEFEQPDVEHFPCLGLAYDAIRKGGTAPAVLSAADEVVVEAFLEDAISYADIYTTLREVLAGHDVKPVEDLDSIKAADGWARRRARRIIQQVSGRR